MKFSFYFRSAIFRIFKVLKVALIRAKIPTFSTNIVGAGFAQILQKSKNFLDEEEHVSSTEDVSHLSSASLCLSVLFEVLFISTWCLDR